MNKVYEENRIKAIADAIREKTGTDTTYTTAEMPNGIDEVYAAGKQAENDAFWVDYQDNGERTDYGNAFAGIGWHNGNFKPTNDITVKRAYMMFRDSAIEGDLVEIAKNLGITVDFTGCQNYQYAFYNSKFTRLGVIDVSSSGMLSAVTVAFYGANRLETIDKFILPTTSIIEFSNTFQGCTALENITFEGVINKDISFKDSTKLSRSSIESVINALSDSVEGRSTVTLSKTAVENAFSVSPNLILPSGNITQTEHDGLTITDNGDGSFTLNGTYQNPNFPNYDLHFTVDENVTWSERQGVYGLFLEGDTTNSINIYTSGATDALSGQGWNHVLEMGNEPLAVNLVIPTGTTFQNVTVRPQLFYDEWQSFVWYKNNFWNIALV